MDIKFSKEKLSKLITKYENLGPIWRKKYNEANTRKNFILPLFEILGWDTRGEDVSEEERASGKRVDYAFKIGGITKFFLEAKPFSVNLDESRWAEQAIWYAYHKSVPWVVLTNFESIKVFNAEWDEQDVERSLVFEIPYKDYLTNDKLWLLSRPSIEKDELDEYAEKEFKKPKRVAVDKQLVADLLRWRDKIYNDFSGYNPLIDKKKIAENVQKVLNRIIFIRACEDRGFEEKSLQEMVRNWEEGRGKSDELVNGLRVLFREFDKNYDSKLFEERILFESEKFVVDDNTLAKVIKETYKGSKGIRWNFNDINGDVLGSIYEQYLGQIQAGESEKKSTKRKSQGIYYTPRYIVDYIIENTLGEVLKNKSAHEASKIKVLDPACGSGSFLIKAFEVLDDHIRKEWNRKGTDLLINYARKFAILTSNIYGVDLDPEAIEIAQLNLLLKTLEKRERLPNLSQNIECGNSLISGTEAELKKYFGKNWKDKKPFNWEERFPDVFKDGGFDVIIGNPPYIDSEEMVRKDKDFRLYCSDIYESAVGNWDIFCVFIQRGLDLIREGGYLGMIVPNKLLSADYAFKIREIIEKYSIISINDYSNIHVFGASVYPVVILIKKNKPEFNHQVVINIFEDNDGIVSVNQKNKINQNILVEYKNSWSPIFNYSKDIRFVDRIIKEAKPLKGFCSVHGAATVNEAYKLKKILKNLDNDKSYFKFINTGTIDRYIELWDKQKTQYIKSSYFKPIALKDVLKDLMFNRYNDSTKSKIIVAGMAKKIESFLDEDGKFLAGKSTTIIESQKIDLKFILGILNSKLLTFIYRNIFKSLSLAGGYLRFGTPQIEELPIIISDGKFVKNFTNEVDKIIRLNKELSKLDSFLNEEEYNKIKKEIEKTDKEIDEKVYNLYGLTLEEIKIVEGDLKYKK